MTMYWYRSFLGKYDPVAWCKERSAEVDAEWCLLCPLRSTCSSPAWFPELKPRKEESRREEVWRKVVSKRASKPRTLKKLGGSRRS